MSLGRRNDKIGVKIIHCCNSFAISLGGMLEKGQVVVARKQMPHNEKGAKDLYAKRLMSAEEKKILFE